MIRFIRATFICVVFFSFCIHSEDIRPQETSKEDHVILLDDSNQEEGKIISNNAVQAFQFIINIGVEEGILPQDVTSLWQEAKRQTLPCLEAIKRSGRINMALVQTFNATLHRVLTIVQDLPEIFINVDVKEIEKNPLLSRKEDTNSSMIDVISNAKNIYFIGVLVVDKTEETAGLLQELMIFTKSLKRRLRALEKEYALKATNSMINTMSYMMKRSHVQSTAHSSQVELLIGFQ